MKKLLCSLVLITLVATAFSQRVYFIYIQADLEQPFSVKMNDKIYSSSSSGYLIMSKLKDSTYPITVVFPRNKWPDQLFKVEVKSNDRGFLLKNFGEKGWGLYDLQTLAVQMSTSAAAIDKPKADAKDVSAFTQVLSKAANDPSLMDKPVKKEEPAIQQAVVREERKPEKAEPVIVKKEEPVVNKEEPVAKKEEPVIKKEEPVVKKEEPKAETIQPVAIQEYKASVVKRKSESSTSEGLGLSFIDEYSDGKKDTISIVIPNPKKVVKDNSKQDKKFLDITADTKDVTPVVKTPVQEQKEEVKEIVKEMPKQEVKKTVGACSGVASENDFLKLRRKMAAESNDDDMVNEAAKYFKTKCFTVAQVKNLSTLFLNDSGKYKFFDASYSHVSDPDNFASLQPELKDEYYINRFKAMMR